MPTLLLSAMLMSLPLGDIYQVQGSYITLMVMNFIIAIAMLGVPLVIRSLVGSGLTSAAAPLGAGAVALMSKAITLTAWLPQKGIMNSLGLPSVSQGANQNPFNTFKPNTSVQNHVSTTRPSQGNPPQKPQS